MAMPRNAALQHHEQLVTTLTVLHLRTDLLQRQLARHTDLSAADRAWLETALGELTQTVRVLTALVSANGRELADPWEQMVPLRRVSAPTSQRTMN
jgi:hypothetical protein